MHRGTFEKPRPGHWELDTVHYSRPISRWAAATFYWDGFTRGFQDGLARYGTLVESMDIAVVDGFFYQCIRFVGAPPESTATPPAFVFKVLSRVHPKMRERNKRASEVFAKKIWREDVKTWDEEHKPKIRARLAALARVCPDALDDKALLRHLDDARKALDDGIYVHHILTPLCLLPVGDFAVHVEQWTGARSDEIMALLRGFSPTSLEATHELLDVVKILKADNEARGLLESTRVSREIVDALRGRQDPLGEAFRAWIDVAGHRATTGIDVADRTLGEMPESIVGALRAALTKTANAAATAEAQEAAVRAMRARVPEQHRARFDELLEEARLVTRIRDERTIHTDYTAIGLLRRALLEAGKRLHARGLLHDVTDVVELIPEELSSLLLEGKGPAPDVTAAYARWRETKTIADAPARLGPPAPPPPPAEWLPRDAARAMRAFAWAMEQSHGSSRAKSDAALVRGTPVSRGVVEGPARLVLDADDFKKVKAGDVLVSRTTTPTYNVLLPLLAGVVTDKGGQLCHTAIVAREYGLPAVVGTNVATTTIPDGALIRLDADAGTVQVLGGGR